MSTKRGDPRLSRAYRKARLQALDRDQHICQYCGAEGATTADHVVPIIKGGDPISLDNLVACCVKCNSQKGSRGQAVFLGSKRTPPVFSDLLSPKTSVMTQQGPCAGQPEQDVN
jgi:5-methylcytosine-specific restriction endonuclease McrA